jgi:hypothetical protein
LGNVSLHVADFMALEYGPDREAGLIACRYDAARLLHAKSRDDFTPGEHLAWDRWAPLVLLLPGVEDWSEDEKAALVRVIRAKGGPCEADYVRQFDAHPRLRASVLKLARTSPAAPGWKPLRLLPERVLVRARAVGRR